MGNPTWYSQPAIEAADVTLGVIQDTARRLFIDRGGLYYSCIMTGKAPYASFSAHSVETILRAMRWLQTRVYPTGSSYSLKFQCEGVLGRYVSNGELLLAAILSGIPVDIDLRYAKRIGSHRCRSALVKGAPARECALVKQISQALEDVRRRRVATSTRHARESCSKILASGCGTPCRVIASAFLEERHHRALFHLWPKNAKAEVRALLLVLGRKAVPQELVDKIVGYLTL